MTTPATVQTAGWIRVYAIDEEMSLATIVYACDAVLVGDYLEPFALPVVVPRTETKGKPERDNYGRVLPGKDRRRTYGAGEFIVIDRGSDHGITPGSQFVVYHDKKEDGNFLYQVAEAVAVEVRENSATLSVTLARTVVTRGRLRVDAEVAATPQCGWWAGGRVRRLPTCPCLPAHLPSRTRAIQRVAPLRCSRR